MNERPGPCPLCDSTAPASAKRKCVGVPIVGTTLREHYRCAQYRRWWDAGHATHPDIARKALDEAQAMIVRLEMRVEDMGRNEAQLRAWVATVRAEAIHPDTVWRIPQRLAVAIALAETFEARV